MFMETIVRSVVLTHNPKTVIPEDTEKPNKDGI